MGTISVKECLKNWSLQRISITKNVPLKWYYSTKNSNDFWCRKLTLKVRNWHLLSADFGVLVRDMKKGVIFDQLSLGLDVRPEIPILKGLMFKECMLISTSGYRFMNR